MDQSANILSDSDYYEIFAGTQESFFESWNKIPTFQAVYDFVKPRVSPEDFQKQIQLMITDLSWCIHRGTKRDYNEIWKEEITKYSIGSPQQLLSIFAEYLQVSLVATRLRIPVVDYILKLTQKNV